jgi:hypothetical protein
MPTPGTNGLTPLLPDALMARVRGEYLDMPGLRLTVAQACRLWQLDVVLCTKVFERLVHEGFLRQTETGFHVACRDRCARLP